VIFLPWADEQGIAALIQELWSQFLVRVQHLPEQTKELTQKDQLLKLLKPGTISKRDLAQTLNVSPSGFSNILALEAMKKELWGREIELTKETLNVPKGTTTGLIFEAAWATQIFQLGSEPARPSEPTQHLMKQIHNYVYGVTEKLQLPIDNH